MFTAAAAATIAAAAGRADAAWAPSERYPDASVQVLDPSFAKYRIFNAAVERLATGMRWSEGPAWFGDGRYVLWSDIPNNRIMRWLEETGVAVQQCQREYPRPAGPAHHLRAWRKARHPHRA
jgi:gluconolactonase